MYNPETLLTFGAQESRRRQTKQQQQNIHHRKLSGRAIWTPLLWICIPEITVFAMGRFTKSEISMAIYFVSSISILEKKNLNN